MDIENVGTEEQRKEAKALIDLWFLFLRLDAAIACPHYIRGYADLGDMVTAWIIQ
jgi:hypothetical protein